MMGIKDNFNKIVAICDHKVASLTKTKVSSNGALSQNLFCSIIALALVPV